MEQPRKQPKSIERDERHAKGSARHSSTSSLQCLCSTFPQVAAELLYAVEIRVPGKHEASSSADKAVEFPAAFANPSEKLFRRLKKYSIGFNGRCQMHTRNAGDLRSEELRAAIPMCGIAQPP